jgi:hypothetical protein
MGKMVVYGDTSESLYWDASITEETASAKSKFEQYVREGYMACRVEEGGSRGIHIVDFDPMAEEIVLFPIIDGG